MPPTSRSGSGTGSSIPTCVLLQGSNCLRVLLRGGCGRHRGARHHGLLLMLCGLRLAKCEALHAVLLCMRQQLGQLMSLLFLLLLLLLLLPDLRLCKGQWRPSA